MIWTRCMRRWRMVKKHDLSIVIVSYNTREILKNCLQSVFSSLQNSLLNTEVIVVDNASTDGSWQMVIKDFPKVKLIANKKNAGFGKGNNQGVNSSTSETVLLLNSDIEVIDNAIEKLDSFFKTQTRKTIIGAKLFNPDESPQPSCGPQYSLLMIVLALFFKGDYMGITRSSPNKISKTDWVMGACMIFDKKEFLSLGGFDEGIFMYMEEIDLQYKAKQKGFEIIFYPQACFIHLGAASSSGRRTPILNVFKGLLYFYKKHKSKTENLLLKLILVSKALAAIILFTIFNQKENQKLYIEALELVVKNK